MRIGRWLVIGSQAGDLYDLARQTANAQGKYANLRNVHQQTREALDLAKGHLRDQARQISDLKLLIPDGVLDKWKDSERVRRMVLGRPQ